MDENRLRKLSGLAETRVDEAKEDKDFADLRKKVTARTKQIQANHKAAEKAYIKATAELLVAELGWPGELEHLIELFQDDGRGPALEKAFKNFERDAAEEAIGLFQDDRDVFHSMIEEPITGPILRTAQKVKL